MYSLMCCIPSAAASCLHVAYYEDYGVQFALQDPFLGELVLAWNSLPPTSSFKDVCRAAVHMHAIPDFNSRHHTS